MLDSASMFRYCSQMAKPRRKSDIRRNAAQNTAALRADQPAPLPRSWQFGFLEARSRGVNVTAAARAVGVARHHVYYATWIDPLFAQERQGVERLRTRTVIQNAAWRRDPWAQAHSTERRLGPVQRKNGQETS
jgi:hypothetical protein